jgi:putative ABC transport system permease protein
MTMLAALHRVLARLRAFFHRDDLDRDFKEELEWHLQLLSDENVRRGLTPEDARRAALIRLGTPASLEVRHRDARGLPAVEAIVLDVRFAVRLLAKDRWYSATAITVLALGIGANAAGFSIINAALLRGLPYENADRLYVLSWQPRSGRRANMSLADLEDWRAATRSFSLAGYRTGEINVSGDRATPEQASATWLTANAFRVLAQQPILGRDFTTDDERPGADAVVLIGYEFWQRRFAGNPGVLGELLRVNGRPATIVGVMDKGMKFPEDTDVWLPYSPTEPDTRRTARNLRVFGRLRDGTDYRGARAETNDVAKRLIAAHSEATKDLAGVRVETFSDRFIGGAGRALFLTVMGAVVLVLLIACANVASLLLARSTGRTREIAVRSAMGATRWRLVRQLLLETLLLSVIGGTIGLLLAVAGVRAFGAALQGGGLPYWVVFDVDYVVFGYVAAMCVATALLSGLAPALSASGTGGTEVLNEGSRGNTAGPRTRRFGTLMVLTELTLTTTLLVAAGLMIRSFMTLYFVDLGFRADGLMTMSLRLPDWKYTTPDDRRAFFDQLESRVAAIAGIESATVTTGVPPLDGGERLLETDASAQRADWRPPFVGTVTISPRFFDVLGVPVVHGRNLHVTDGTPGGETVVINERLAAEFFPGDDPVGRRLRFVSREPGAGEPREAWRTIVGVVPTIKHGSPQDGYENAVVYIPYRQEAPATASLLLRSSLPPESVMNAVRREVQAIDADQPVGSIQTFAQVLAGTRWWWRTWGAIFGVFAVIALVLSAIGLYGLIAYSVARRTQELGVRIALGAQPLDICWMLLRRAAAQLAIGLTLGLGAALLLSNVLWGGGMIVITPWDPITYVSIGLLLTVVSIAASLIPARRAMRIDPVIALRAE